MKNDFFLRKALAETYKDRIELSRLHKLFCRLAPLEREIQANQLINVLRSKSAYNIQQVLIFFVRCITLKDLPENSANKFIKAMRTLADRSSTSDHIKLSICMVFNYQTLRHNARHKCIELMLLLSRHHLQEVRASAVFSLGASVSPNLLDPGNEVIMQRIIDVWNDLKEAPEVKRNALHSLGALAHELESDRIRQAVSDVVVAALASEIPEFRYEALWILGGLRGFRIESKHMKTTSALLLRTLKENRDIHEGWFLRAFELTQAALPKWAESKLEVFRENEKTNRSMIEHYAHEEREEVRNREEKEAKKRSAGIRYDVALSFAGEDRKTAEQLAKLLAEQGVEVFYDDYEQVELWGKDLYQHLQRIYKESAYYCVIFISCFYERKLWTRHELRQAQERAFRENREYILPVRMDDTVIPGINETIAYINLKDVTIKELAAMVLSKLRTKQS